MTTELKPDRRQAQSRLVDEHIRAENTHDLDAIMATFGPRARFNLNAIALNDTESIRGLYDGFGFGGRGSFSNLRAEVTQRHVGDESIVVEMMLRGKHTADFQGIAATNREFEIPACAIFEFDEAGGLAGERVYFDAALLLQQLGVLG